MAITHKTRRSRAFPRTRTEEGRWRATCDRCQSSQASWTPSLLDRWQQVHAQQPCQPKQNDDKVA